jgi:hypothetical protein
MTHTRPVIDRREALRRAAVLLGGALPVPTVAGVLAGCEARAAREDTWSPRVLTPEQAELVAAIAEHILPETDTPGARAVGVHRFIDAMLGESFGPDERQPILDGLAALDAAAFLRSSPREQLARLEQLDRQAFAQPGSHPHFFRTLKELVVLGYYTSEIGATRELRHAPIPGRFEGCVPLADVGRTWAV